VGSTSRQFSGQYRASIAEAAQALGVNAIITEFRNDSELERAIDTFADQPEGGLIALPGPQTRSHHSRQLMAQLAARYRLPAIHWDQTFPVDGGLMSYGGDWGDLISSAASYVDRILHGTKVSELPFQYPTRFKFIINLKTAKALSLTIPPNLLALADEVIE
jgi:putative ABC transport system substrate-binding protein